MVIYHFEHIAALSHLLTLRINKHSSEKAVLVGCDISDKNQLSAFCEKHLFDHVISYPYKLGFQEPTKEKVLEVISACFDVELAKNGLDLEFAIKIYTSDDAHNAFAIYLDGKNISYTYLEPISNWFNDKTRYDQRYIRGIVSEAYHKLYKAISPIGDDNECIKSIIIYPNTDIKDNDLVERYDFDGEFLKIPEEKKRIILSCFDIDYDMLTNKKISLLLTNSTNCIVPNIRRFYLLNSYNQEKILKDDYYSPEYINLLYAIILDYFADDGCFLVCKNHPYAEVDFEAIVGNNVNIIDKYMLVEYLLLIEGIQIYQILSIGTSAIFKLESMGISSNIKLGLEFCSVYYFFNKLFTILFFLDIHSKCEEIHYFGIDTSIIEVIIKHLFKDLYRTQCSKDNYLPKFVSNNYYIINTSFQEPRTLVEKALLTNNLLNASNDCIVFFTNSLNEYCFCDLDRPELLDYVIPIKIKRVPIKEHPLCDTSDEIFYIFTKNLEKHKLIKNFTLSRRLKYSGIELTVEILPDDEAKLEKMRCFNEALKVELIRRPLLTAYNTMYSERNAIIEWKNNIAADRDNIAADRDNIAADRDNIAADRDNIAADRDNIAADRDNIEKEYKQWMGYLTESLLWKIALLIVRAGRLLRKVKRKIWNRFNY